MHLRDRLISFFGLAVLAILVTASAYYAIKSNFDDGASEPNKDSPDFATRDCVITIFDRDGTGKHRLFSEYAEHYSDGHSVSIRPKLVTLSPDKPQLKISANTASTMDEGQTVVFTGNIVLTRNGDKNNAPLRLTTSRAGVNTDTQVVTGEAPVRIEHGTDTSTGIGFTFDNVDRTATLYSDVHTVIIPKKKLR